VHRHGHWRPKKQTISQDHAAEAGVAFTSLIQKLPLRSRSCAQGRDSARGHCRPAAQLRGLSVIRILCVLSCL
jgi:hypothetical protein